MSSAVTTAVASAGGSFGPVTRGTNAELAGDVPICLCEALGIAEDAAAGSRFVAAADACGSAIAETKALAAVSSVIERMAAR